MLMEHLVYAAHDALTSTKGLQRDGKFLTIAKIILLCQNFSVQCYLIVTLTIKVFVCTLQLYSDSTMYAHCTCFIESLQFLI